jgi:hypothetical protein
VVGSIQNAGCYAASNTLTQKTLTADAVEKFLRENEIPVLIENGGMCLVPSRE